jgi:hypothetical protein
MNKYVQYIAPTVAGVVLVVTFVKHPIVVTLVIASILTGYFSTRK